MTARKPKTELQLAEVWDRKPQFTRSYCHLAGQRTGYARARREAREKLQAAYASEQRKRASERGGFDPKQAIDVAEKRGRLEGIRLAALALNIKLENV